jgi:hypothetical protein
MSQNPLVTDHAVVRWLECVEHVDIEALRRRLSAAAAVGIAHGAPSVLLGSGRLIIVERKVISVMRRQDVAHLQAVFAQAESGR